MQRFFEHAEPRTWREVPPLMRPAVVARVAPFALFVVLLALRGALPPDNPWGLDARWVYGLSALLVGTSLAFWWRDYGELKRQNAPTLTEILLGIGTGLVVFGLWIRLDAPWMVIGEPSAPYVPLQPDGSLDLPLVALRWLGATLVVPLMEELFWRSFLMRWIEHAQFEVVDPRRIGLKAVVLSSFIFTLAHTLWLAAALAGLAYAWLYVRTGKLWVPVLAHVVTNGALGAWVIATGRWHFW